MIVTKIPSCLTLAGTLVQLFKTNFNGPVFEHIYGNNKKKIIVDHSSTLQRSRDPRLQESSEKEGKCLVGGHYIFFQKLTKLSNKRTRAILLPFNNIESM
jgi:hypothetical protein